MNTSTELGSLVEMNELDDLGDLFEFGDIDLNTITDPGQFGENLQQQHGTHTSTPFQDLRETPPILGTTPHDLGGHEQYDLPHSIEQQHCVNRPKSHVSTSSPYTSESMYHPAVQQTYNPYSQNFQFQPQPGFPANHHVPPTPNSYEMHGETGRFMQQQQQLDRQQQAILEQRYQIRKDDAIAFTPMVSPAGTPLYTTLPEFTIPGAYFSPLTSPMLHAQHQQQAQHQQHQSHRSHPSTAPHSTTIPPMDPNLDTEMLDGTTLPDSAGPKPRRSRRKVTTPKLTSGTGRVKQNSAQNAQKRKSSTLPHTGAENAILRSVTSQPSTASVQVSSQFDSSEGDSISPEALSDSVMMPPPRPGSSLNPSPVIVAEQQQQHQQVAAAFTLGAAATPKSLLTTRGTQQINGQQDVTPVSTHAWSGLNGLDDLSLPEAATGQARRKPSLTQINTQLVPASTAENTPRLSARKTPKLGPLSTPSSARPGSGNGSAVAVESPMTGSTPSAILNDKKEGKPGRGRQKRGSLSANSSKLVSPALVPKISPSIKPLLPEGTTLSTATQAMLLASKSNYQNLLEGNHLPGVTYPDSLSTGLTSKRTSHKVAEQGRRNRINDALKEMQSLIPKSSGLKSEVDGDDTAELADEDKFGDGSFKDDANAKSNSSKAATVELANEYIKKMQKDSAAQAVDIVQLRLQNEELKKRLAERSSVSPADSSSTGSRASTRG